MIYLHDKEFPDDKQTQKDVEPRFDEMAYPDPPPYSPPIPGPSHFPQPEQPDAVLGGMRVNRYYAGSHNSSTKGIYILDPDLPTPINKQGADNLNLQSHNGAIVATVSVVGTTPTKASITVSSHNRKAILNIVSRVPGTRLKLSATSHNNGVAVFLPRDFCGIIRYVNKNQGVTFSSGILQNYTGFGEKGKTGSGFIGRFPAPEWGDLRAGVWAGDELDVRNHNGSIKIHYTDEGASSPDRESSNMPAEKRGFMSSLKRSLSSLSGDDTKGLSSPQDRKWDSK